jgi:hypothetical protein
VVRYSLFGVEFPRVPKTPPALARQAIDFTVFPSGVPAFPNHVIVERSHWSVRSLVATLGTRLLPKQPGSEFRNKLGFPH